MLSRIASQAIKKTLELIAKVSDSNEHPVQLSAFTAPRPRFLEYRPNSNPPANGSVECRTSGPLFADFEEIVLLTGEATLLTQGVVVKTRPPVCEGCRNYFGAKYANRPTMVCAIHPFGVETDNCLDFEPCHNPTA